MKIVEIVVDVMKVVCGVGVRKIISAYLVEGICIPLILRV